MQSKSYGDLGGCSQTHPKPSASFQKCGQACGGTNYRYVVLHRRRLEMLTTGRSLQPYLPAGAAASPVILATDKTQLTQFSGNKSAYPVYLTLGNIPRAIHHRPSEHACICPSPRSLVWVSPNANTKHAHSAFSMLQCVSSSVPSSKPERRE